MVTVAYVNQDTVADTVSMVTMLLPHNTSHVTLSSWMHTAIVMLMALKNNSEESSMASQWEDI